MIGILIGILSITTFCLIGSLSSSYYVCYCFVFCIPNTEFIELQKKIKLISRSWHNLFEAEISNQTKNITLYGYLTPPRQYPVSIFKENETYQFLSQSKESTYMQVPLIVKEKIICKNLVEIKGKIIFREDPEKENRSYYTLINMAHWKCIE